MKTRTKTKPTKQKQPPPPAHDVPAPAELARQALALVIELNSLAIRIDETIYSAPWEDGVLEENIIRSIDSAVAELWQFAGLRCHVAIARNGGDVPELLVHPSERVRPWLAAILAKRRAAHEAEEAAEIAERWPAA